MIQDSSVLTLSDGVSFQPLGIGEGAVVLIVESGQLFTCNDTTSAFLAAVDGRRIFAEVVDGLLDTFEVSADELRSDLAALAADLQQEGIVRAQ
ncbi:MAG: PqqD family peptide modification chaperone [Hyphomicrobiaceae bacterium]|nr:PqqD family peptide modification chaperone [Hyphomicrobiaceae bacterium]